MQEINLPQEEADALIAMEKHRADDQQYAFPLVGGEVIIPLVSPNRRESFLLDVRRGRIDLFKGTYQNRARQVVLLVRLDFGGQPHRNPDDIEVASPHLHLYREGYGDKWAEPVPHEIFTNLTDFRQTLEEFMQYCHITQKPLI